MDKRTRQFAIKDILATHAITTQDQLARELKKRGLLVTQATLSRDMKDLGVMWATVNGSTRYTLQQTGGGAEAQILRPFIGAEVNAIDANEVVVVVHTLPGCANTVAEFIDVQHHPDIIGTVAGDNTVLVIPRTMKRTQQVVQFLKTKLIEGVE
jgi:transcriptional regulator of arginine metabolism